MVTGLNRLQIKGRRIETESPLVKTAVTLTAEYRGISHYLSNITGMPSMHKAILHFESPNQQLKGLNFILLLENCRGAYKATGLSAYDRGDGGPEFYNMGDDLEIIVDELADNVIKELPEVS